MVLAIASQRTWSSTSLDVQTALLLADVEEDADVLTQSTLAMDGRVLSIRITGVVFLFLPVVTDLQESCGRMMRPLAGGEGGCTAVPDTNAVRHMINTIPPFPRPRPPTSCSSSHRLP